MTTTHEALEAAMDEGETFTVVAEPESRLAQLQASYADAKAKADDAAKKLDAIKAGIRAELNAMAPEETRVELRGDPETGAPALALRYSERWTLDSNRMKTEDPLTYVRYARKSGSWSLSQVRV